MRAEDLRNHLRSTPFQPVKLTFTDGSDRVVKYPEMVFLTRSTVTVGEASAPDSGVADEFTVYNLLHLVRIDPVPAGN